MSVEEILRKIWRYREDAIKEYQNGVLCIKEVEEPERREDGSPRGSRSRIKSTILHLRQFAKGDDTCYKYCREAKGSVSERDMELVNEWFDSCSSYKRI